MAADAGWLRRVGDVIRTGVTAEAAVARVAVRRATGCAGSPIRICASGPADLDELADRLLSALFDPAMAGGRRGRRPSRFRRGRPVGAAAGAGRSAGLARQGVAGVAIEEARPAGHAAIVARALGLPALGGRARRGGGGRSGDRAARDADEGRLICGLMDVPDLCARAWRRGPRARRYGRGFAIARR